MTIFTRFLTILTVISGFGLQAQEKFVEGKDYKRLDIEIPLHKKGQPEVAEYFWHGCPHCYHLYPKTKKWQKESKPENVAFYHVPATSGNWEFAAQGMYVADKLNIDEADFHDAFFNEIHVVKNRGVAFNDKVFAKFLENKFDVKKEDYEKAKKSLQVESKFKAAKNRNLLADVNSVPVFVVNGKYLVSTEMAKTEGRMFEIINGLLAKDKASYESEEKNTIKSDESDKTVQPVTNPAG